MRGSVDHENNFTTWWGKWINNMIKSMKTNSITITTNSKDVKSITISMNELIRTAVEIYAERITPIFNFQTYANGDRRLIKDNINEITKYLSDSSVFIKHFSNQCSFQFDLVIILNGIDDDSDSDSSDSDSDSDSDEKSTTGQYKDDIGNVHQNVQQNDCNFYCGDVEKCKFNEIYDKYIKLMEQKYQEKKYDSYMDNYPHQRRIIALIDKRNTICIVNNDKNNYKIQEIQNENENTLTFFEPPSDCRNYPDFVVDDEQKYDVRAPEWNFQAIRHCIIPSSEYPKEPPTKGIKTKARNILITKNALSSCNMLTFSFIVDSQNRIRCYMWWKARCIILLPQDIEKILPKMFVNGVNFSFTDKDKCTWKDEDFEKMCTLYSD